MHTANISYTRNHLSEVLARVKQGETILIVDRQRPVARLEPVTGPAARRPASRSHLVRRGLVRPAKAGLDPEAFASLPLPTAQGDGDILTAVLADREEGR